LCMKREKYNNFCDVGSASRKIFLLLRICVEHGGQKSLNPHIFLIETRKINSSMTVYKLKTVHTVMYRTNFTFMWPCIVTNFFIIKPIKCTNFTNLFWHEILHVSDSSSVHHQEFIHCTLINDICHTGL